MLGSRPPARILLALVLLGVLVIACKPVPAGPSPMPATALPAALTPSLSPTAQPTTTPLAPGTVGLASPSEGKTMMLTVVFDNNRYDSRLQSGWGFAAWIAYGGQTVLFDTGASGALLLDNMAALGLDPATIDIIVLSHNHGDHTGGLTAVLAANPQVTVYLPQAFPTHFKQQVLAAGAEIVEVDAPLEILPGLWSTGQMGTGITEQAMVVRTDKGLVVVTGCAHPGVDEMVARAKQVGVGEIALVVGGFHLGSATRARIDEIIGAFRQLGVQQVAPCHCTGRAARERFREAYGEDFDECGAGWQWQSEDLLWRPASDGIPAQIGVAAAAVAPSEPRVLYLAAYVPGGLYRSDDGGASWQAADGGLEAIAPLSIAVHPKDPDVAWVGTIVGGYHTTDGGQHWEPIAGLPRVAIYTVLVTPDGRMVYAGGEGLGAWHSDDGGRSWSAIWPDAAPETILSLALTPDSQLLAGTAGQGVWQSENGGTSWQQGGSELAEAHVSQLVAVDSGRWYALAEGSLYRSDDGGQSWQSVHLPGLEALAFAAEPGPTGRLYVGTRGGGVAVSLDGGQTWEQLGSELSRADITCLLVDPNTPDHAFLGTRYHGLYHTSDGGLSWTLVSAGIGQTVINALVQDPTDPLVLFAGALDGIYRSGNGGEQWRLVSGDLGKLFVQSLALSPDGARLYAGTQIGIFTSPDSGATWDWDEEDTGGIAVFDLLVDPLEANRIYGGSWGHNILQSNDGGQTWAPIHHGLETLSVHAVAVDPSNPQHLYAGTVEAIYHSRDGGQTWQASPLSERPLSTLALSIDPGEPARVYAGTTDGVYLSTDDGATWQPAGHRTLQATVTALAMYPGSTHTILAGTEHDGLYRSTDGGATWQTWGLESTSVYAILVDQAGTVWIGTERGVFRDR